MYNRQQNIIVGIIGGSFVLVLLLTWVFSGLSPLRRQSPVVSPSATRQANDAKDDTVVTAPGSRPAVGSENAEAKPRIVVKTDVSRGGGREVSIGLLLANTDGRSVRVTDIVQTRQPPPSLRIVDEAGQVVAQGSFSYG